MTALIAAAVVCASPVVHDGDTIRCGRERVRLASIDAPELPGSPKCARPRRSNGSHPGWCDYRMAAQSRDALAALLAGQRVLITRQGTDIYGRTLATVSVNGRDAGAILIARGLARRW